MPATPAQALEGRTPPPPEPCRICPPPTEGELLLLTPVPCEIERSTDRILGWRFECSRCGMRRYVAAAEHERRSRDLPGTCDRRGGPAVV